MIKEEDLHEAIAECHGAKNPNANTCLKLASYYTILDHLKEQHEKVIVPSGYSYTAEPPAARYSSNSEFGAIVSEIDEHELMKVIDEAMETMRIMVPNLYNAIMRKLTALK